MYLKHIIHVVLLALISAVVAAPQREHQNNNDHDSESSTQLKASPSIDTTSSVVDSSLCSKCQQGATQPLSTSTMARHAIETSCLVSSTTTITITRSPALTTAANLVSGNTVGTVKISTGEYFAS